MRYDPSFIFTKTIGDDHGLLEGLMTPFASMSSMILLISSVIWRLYSSGLLLDRSAVSAKSKLRSANSEAYFKRKMSAY